MRSLFVTLTIGLWGAHYVRFRSLARSLRSLLATNGKVDIKSKKCDF